MVGKLELEKKDSHARVNYLYYRRAKVSNTYNQLLPHLLRSIYEIPTISISCRVYAVAAKMQ